jgi:hypothetical protein
MNPRAARDYSLVVDGKTVMTTDDEVAVLTARCKLSARDGARARVYCLSENGALYQAVPVHVARGHHVKSAPGVRALSHWMTDRLAGRGKGRKWQRYGLWREIKRQSGVGT